MSGEADTLTGGRWPLFERGHRRRLPGRTSTPRKTRVSTEHGTGTRTRRRCRCRRRDAGPARPTSRTTAESRWARVGGIQGKNETERDRHVGPEEYRADSGRLRPASNPRHRGNCLSEERVPANRSGRSRRRSEPLAENLQQRAAMTPFVVAPRPVADDEEAGEDGRCREQGPTGARRHPRGRGATATRASGTAPRSRPAGEPHRGCRRPRCSGRGAAGQRGVWTRRQPGRPRARGYRRRTGPRASPGPPPSASRRVRGACVPPIGRASYMSLPDRQLESRAARESAANRRALTQP